jgi:hypothetical protein
MGLIVGPASAEIKVNSGVWTLDRAAGSLARAGIWLSPIFIGMVHDWITRRRVHPVYTLASITLFFFAFRFRATSAIRNGWACNLRSCENSYHRRSTPAHISTRGHMRFSILRTNSTT